MHKHEIQSLVKHGCFKVCEMVKNIEGDVDFHAFEALEKDDIVKCI
jgi:hypothetical protein